MGESRVISRMQDLQDKAAKRQALVEKLKAELSLLHGPSGKAPSHDALRKALNAYLEQGKNLETLSAEKEKPSLTEEIRRHMAALNMLPSRTAQDYLNAAGIQKSAGEALASDWRNVGAGLWDSWAKYHHQGEGAGHGQR